MTAAPGDQRLINIVLDEKTFVRRRPEVEAERAKAIYDLLEENYFRPLGGFVGPFILRIRLLDNRLRLEVQSEDGLPLMESYVPMSPFRGIVKDYFIMCESYYSAMQTMTTPQIEAVDAGRRAMHDEGSQLLIQHMKETVEIDIGTARRLFTLICILHVRG